MKTMKWTYLALIVGEGASYNSYLFQNFKIQVQAPLVSYFIRADFLRFNQ